MQGRRVAFMQTHFLADLLPQITTDGRIRAAWLEGSLRRGTADRYSDVDIHLLLEEGTLASFQDQARPWLEAVRPLVLFSLMFDGRMINAMTDQGLRVDIWLHDDGSATIDPAGAHVLKESAGTLHRAADAPPMDRAKQAQQLDAQLREFWRCIALTPSVIGRGEKLVSAMGVTVEVGLLTQLILTGYEIPRLSGVKKLNPFLPADVQQALEAALDTPFTETGLVQTHLALAAIAHTHGNILAERWEFDYPAALEATALGYVVRELRLLDLPAVAPLLAAVDTYLQDGTAWPAS